MKLARAPASLSEIKFLRQSSGIQFVPAPAPIDSMLVRSGVPDMSTNHMAMAALIVFAIPAWSGNAQEIGKPGHGLALAEWLCAQCHAVSGREDESPNPAAPPFRDIASTSGMT